MIEYIIEHLMLVNRSIFTLVFFKAASHANPGAE